MPNFPIASPALALLLLAGAAANAQTLTWASPISGNWNHVANWNPQNVPDAPTETAVIGPAGTYTVSCDLTATIGALSITNPAADVRINAGRGLAIAGTSLLNDGTLTINPSAAANNTFLQFNTDATLSGTGRLILNGVGDRAYLSTVTGVTLTHASTHTMSGFGNIYAALINDGVIIADSPGNTLAFVGFAKTNNNLIKSFGGTVLIDAVTLSQSTGARLLADGGKVSLSNCSVSGGELDSAGAGVVEASTGGSTLINVTNSGTLNVAAGRAIAVSGIKLTNNGLITINPSASAQDTFIQFNSTASLDGTGRLTLNGVGNRAYLSTTTGFTATNGPDHTIGGYGLIYATLVNDGLITADVPSQILGLTSGAKTNNAVMQASGAGTTLRIDTVVITQGTSGTILADAGKVSYINSTVSGGTLQSANSGIHEISASSSTFSDVTCDAPLNLIHGTALGVSGTGLTNNGLITVNPAAAANDTFIQFNTTGSLAGTGQLVLNGAGNRAYLNSVTGTTITHGATHKIAGYGVIYASLINEGTIDADVSGQILALTGASKTNSALIKASAGTIRVDGITVTQGPSGRLVADTGMVSLVNCTITGGALQTSGAGATEVTSGGATLTNVTNEGALNILVGTGVAVSGSGLVNNGQVTINPTTAAGDAFLRFLDSGTLGGTGTLTLNAINNRSYLQAILGVTITNGSDHTITGVGNMYGTFVNQGRIAPGLPYARITLDGTLAQASTGILSTQIAGAVAGTTYDQFAATGAVSLAGTLEVDLAGGYTPGPTSTYTLLTAASVTGQFDTLDLPVLPANAKVVYRPTAVELMMCYANCDGSSGSPVLTANDFTCFLTRYAAADRYANCDGSTGDPVLTANDFICYIIAYAAGCSAT